MERRNMPEQERSIKDREEQLFFEPDDPATAKPPPKPFPAYLRETPPNPMSPAIKTLLWIVGIVVLLLFLAALWRAHRPARRPRLKSVSAKVEASALAPSCPYPPLRRVGTMGTWLFSDFACCTAEIRSPTGTPTGQLIPGLADVCRLATTGRL
jgi:hypothetical protein